MIWLQIIEVLDKHNPTIVALDANMSHETLKSLVKYANERDVLSTC